MSETHYVNAWPGIIGSLALLTIILAAFGLMLGIVKIGDALRCVGMVLGIVIALAFAPLVLACLWSSMSIWQRIGLAGIGIGVWLSLQPRRKTRKHRKE